MGRRGDYGPVESGVGSPLVSHVGQRAGRIAADPDGLVQCLVQKAPVGVRGCRIRPTMGVDVINRSAVAERLSCVVDKNPVSTLTCSLSQPDDYRGATNPTGPAAMHTDNAAVFARTSIASPAPGSRTKTRLSPGRTGTFVSVPSDSDIVIEPSLLAR